MFHEDPKSYIAGFPESKRATVSRNCAEYHVATANYLTIANGEEDAARLVGMAYEESGKASAGLCRAALLHTRDDATIAHLRAAITYLEPEQLGPPLTVRHPEPLAERDKMMPRPTPTQAAFEPEAAFRVAEDYAAKGDVTQAVHWYKKAASAGHPESQHAVGVWHEARGDEEQAVGWWRQAATAGFEPSIFKLGMWHAKRGELETAYGRFQKLDMSSQGMDAAMYMLGNAAEERGDYDRAIFYYSQAADHAKALFRLGMVHKKSGDIDRAIHWYERAAGAGVRDAMFNLGGLYAERGDDEHAIHWYTEAADAGDDDAMCLIGDYYRQQGEYERALAWLQKAVEAGNGQAMIKRVALVLWLTQRHSPTSSAS